MGNELNIRTLAYPKDPDKRRHLVFLKHLPDNDNYCQHGANGYMCGEVDIGQKRCMRYKRELSSSGIGIAKPIWRPDRLQECKNDQCLFMAELRQDMRSAG